MMFSLSTLLSRQILLVLDNRLELIIFIFHGLCFLRFQINFSQYVYSQTKKVPLSLLPRNKPPLFVASLGIENCNPIPCDFLPEIVLLTCLFRKGTYLKLYFSFHFRKYLYSKWNSKKLYTHRLEIIL